MKIERVIFFTNIRLKRNPKEKPTNYQSRYPWLHNLPPNTTLIFPTQPKLSNRKSSKYFLSKTNIWNDGIVSKSHKTNKSSKWNMFCALISTCYLEIHYENVVTIKKCQYLSFLIAFLRIILYEKLETTMEYICGVLRKRPMLIWGFLSQESCGLEIPFLGSFKIFRLCRASDSSLEPYKCLNTEKSQNSDEYSPFSFKTAILFTWYLALDNSSSDKKGKRFCKLL